MAPWHRWHRKKKSFVRILSYIRIILVFQKGVFLVPSGAQVPIGCQSNIFNFFFFISQTNTHECSTTITIFYPNPFVVFNSHALHFA